MFSIQNALGDIGEQALSVSCFLRDQNFETPTCFLKMLLTAGVLPFMLICCTVFWGIVYVRKRKANMKKDMERQTKVVPAASNNDENLIPIETDGVNLPRSRGVRLLRSKAMK